MSDKNDNIWDIDFLLPPKKTTAVFSRDTDAVEIDVNPVERKIPDSAKIPKRGSAKPVTASNYKAEPITRYQPENKLIKSVSVWRWPSKYTFYERFRTDAIKFYKTNGEECEYTEFFSYMPQYMQLNPRQKGYYFWWRENARKNVWLKADYSYIYLYIYEIINIPDFISPSKGLELLCDVWLAYREQMPKLDRYMTEWVTDYCLINLLEPPYERLRPIMGVLLENSTFREFFTPTGGDFFRDALFILACSYNWRQSKFYNADTAPLFERHIPAAFNAVCDVLEKTDKRFIFGDGSLTPATLTRDAYTGSLCAYNVKRRIDVEYYAVSRSPELRMLVTDIVKAAENQVRIIAGVKSRFPVQTLSDEVKNAISDYFVQFKPAKQSKKADDAPEYMKQYDAPTSGITPEDALKIEARSWEVTEKLVEAFNEDETAEEDRQKEISDDKDEIISHDNTAIAAEPNIDITNDTNNTSSDTDTAISPDVLRLLQMLRNLNHTGFISLVSKLHLMPETAVERVNEALYERIGDIVVEEDGEGGYKLIDDYIEDIDEILRDG